MDQDSFRLLLSSGSSTRKTAPATSSSAKVAQASQAPAAAFKPRKITNKGGKEKEREKEKEKDSEYRDRAAERREGINDYAQVEALLKEFEDKNAANADRKAVDDKRKYLGGDGMHSVLVKGLDFALLEQNKARAADSQSRVIDDELEQVFQESSSALPKKRNREDIIRNLKQRQANGTESAVNTKGVDPIESAKQKGKFKPIGAPSSEKEGTTEKRKKKKRKIAPTKQTSGAQLPEPTSVLDSKSSQGETIGETPKPARATDAIVELPQRSDPKPLSPTPVPKLTPVPVPEGDDVDVDIFSDAGDYEGFDFGDDDEGEEGGSKPAKAPILPITESNIHLPRTNWFGEPLSPEPDSHPQVASTAPEQRSPPLIDETSLQAQMVPETEDVPMRLTSLSSSALPSIRDFLDADTELSAAEKRKAKKEKRKAATGGIGAGGGAGQHSEKKGLNAAAKLDRDHKRITSFMNKQGSSK